MPLAPLKPDPTMCGLHGNDPLSPEARSLLLRRSAEHAAGSVELYRHLQQIYAQADAEFNRARGVGAVDGRLLTETQRDYDEDKEGLYR